MQTGQYAKFYNLMRFLKKSIHIPESFYVRRTSLPKGLDGDCTIRKGKFRVRVKKDLGESAAIDALIHEVSHCLSWAEDDDEQNTAMAIQAPREGSVPRIGHDKSATHTGNMFISVSTSEIGSRGSA